MVMAAKHSAEHAGDVDQRPRQFECAAVRGWALRPETAVVERRCLGPRFHLWQEGTSPRRVGSNADRPLLTGEADFIRSLEQFMSQVQAPRRSASQVPEHSPPFQEPAPAVPDRRPEPIALLLPALTVTVRAPLPATLPVDGDGARAVVEHGAVRDADRIAVGAIAGALLGHDHDAPEAVIARGRGRRRWQRRARSRTTEPARQRQNSEGSSES